MRHPRLVLAIFILSGAAGLMYEVVWSRQLVLVFGNTTQAVSAGDRQMEGRVGLIGALRLYLDFINMFLLILRVAGRRR